MDFPDILLNIPLQFKLGQEAARNFSFVKKGFNRIIFCGMGGSIMPAELLMTFCEINGIPNHNLYIHRDYKLPNWASKNDLIICISWSGNTDETISSYKEAAEKNITTVAITKGGKLKELAQSSYCLSLLTQTDIPPRIGIAYMFSALLTFLNDSAILKFPEDSLTQLLNLENLLKPADSEETGRKIADQINKFTPIIYSSYKWRSLALLWKINFNENAKIHSFWNHFPSIAHNEIVGFQSSKDFSAILLSDTEESVEQTKKMDNAVKLLDELKINYQIVPIQGTNTIHKLFNNYILANWASYFLAVNHGQDPSSDELLDKFKNLEKLN